MGNPPIQYAQPMPRHPDADKLASELQPDRRPSGMWPALHSVPVSVLVPVKNEASNIVECLRHLNWANHLVVVDSQSTDQTVPLAQAMGADVYQFYMSPEGWPKKRNWAIENVQWRHPWLLVMDADEHMTPELAQEVVDVVTGKYQPKDARTAGCGDGYWVNRRFMFMGQWIKHCGYFPSYNVRLFKHSIGRYERMANVGNTNSGDNEVHEHVILSTGQPGYLQHDFLHYAYPDLYTWVEKHNRYSNWEAHVMAAGNQGQLHSKFFGNGLERRRWIKRFAGNLPMRPSLRFFYNYILRGGILDGYPGYVMCRLLGWYEFVSMAKYYEMKSASPPSPPRR